MATSYPSPTRSVTLSRLAVSMHSLMSPSVTPRVWSFTSFKAMLNHHVALSCVQGLGVLPAHLPATVFEQHHIKEGWAALELGGPHLTTRVNELLGHLTQLNSPAARARVDADILLNTHLTSDVSLIIDPPRTVILSGPCTPRAPLNITWATLSMTEAASVLVCAVGEGAGQAVAGGHVQPGGGGPLGKRSVPPTHPT